MHIFMHHLSLYFETTAQISEVLLRGQIRIYEGKYRYLRATTDICPEGKKPTLTFSYYWTCKNEHIATKYVINVFIHLFIKIIYYLKHIHLRLLPLLIYYHQVDKTCIDQKPSQLHLSAYSKFRKY